MSHLPATAPCAGTSFPKLTSVRTVFMPHLPRRFAFALGIFVAAATISARAADPAFVGVLALAVDEEVAKQVGIPEETRRQIAELVDRREAEVLNLALEARSLPEAERAAKLRPFVEESERLGLELLTP